MKMRFTADWLSNRIRRDPDVDVDAGRPIASAEIVRHFVRDAAAENNEILVQAFGVLVRQLRRKAGLSIAELSDKIEVNQIDLSAIENNPGYIPRPRAVHKIAEFFKLPAGQLMKLSGAAVSRDRELEGAALRFAAKSGDMSKLTKAEAEGLNEFIRWLSDHKGG